MDAIVIFLVFDFGFCLGALYTFVIMRKNMKKKEGK
jgi:hypothetical protein